MGDSVTTNGPRGGRAGVLHGILSICVVGGLLGLSYNWFGLHSPRGWGLPWIAEDPRELLAGLEVVTVDGADTPGDAADQYVTTNSDPAGILAPAQGSILPPIESQGRPVGIDLAALQLYVDAGAALIIDARDRSEYVESHIPGSINLPYDVVVTDPALLESLDTGGRPIITYCGGGECEVSINLAFELFAAGHERVAVYKGGFPEWTDAGLAVASGDGEALR